MLADLCILSIIFFGQNIRKNHVVGGVVCSENQKKTKKIASYVVNSTCSCVVCFF